MIVSILTILALPEINWEKKIELYIFVDKYKFGDR